VARVGQRARVVAAEQTVAGPRHQVIAEIARHSRHEAERGRRAPGTAQGAEDPERGVGLPEKTLVGPTARQDEIEGVEVPRVAAMARQDLARELALQRGEPESASRIARDDEPVQAVAETAHPVVENEGRLVRGAGRLTHGVPREPGGHARAPSPTSTAATPR